MSEDDSDMRSGEEVAENARWLRGYLSDRGFVLGSKLDRAVATAERAAEHAETDDEAALLTTLGHASFVNYLAKAAHRAPESLASWIARKEGSGEAVLGDDHDVSMVVGGGSPSAQKNRMWELIVAAILSGVGAIDADEPDIGLFDSGVRWGIACKSLTSRSQLLRRIKQGAKQINAAHCQSGIVFLNITRLLEADSCRTKEGIVQQVEAVLGELVERRGVELTKRLGGTKTRAVAVMGHGMLRKAGTFDVRLAKVARCFPLSASDSEVLELWERCLRSDEALRAYRIRQS